MEEPTDPKPPKTREECLDVVVNLRCSGRLATREDYAEHLPVLVGLILKRAFDRDEAVKSVLIERQGIELVLNVRNTLAWMAIKSWREWDRLLEATFPEPRVG